MWINGIDGKNRIGNDVEGDKEKENIERKVRVGGRKPIKMRKK